MRRIMKTRLRASGLLIGAALFLATSCGGLKVPGANSTTSSGPPRASGDPREDLKKAFTAQLAAKSFRYRLEFSFASGHAEAEFVAPDRYHITMAQQLPGQGSDLRQEMIIIGKDTFMKIRDMPWQKAAAGGGETTMATILAKMAEQFRETDVAQRMTKYEDVKYVGPEVLDGAPALVYQFKLKETKGQTPGKIWISANDGLPRKIEHEGGTSPIPNANTSKNKLTVTYYDYNASIKIEPPV